MDSLEVSTAAGSVDVVVNTAFGIMSCTVNPVEIGGQILKAAQSLQQAAETAELCEEICRDIMQTAIARVPVVCKLLRLGQLFPKDGDAAELDKAMRQCCSAAVDALHAAVTAMYQYLQCNRLGRLRQAASVEKLMDEKRKQLRNRFDDVNAYMTLANLLSDRQSTQQAQHTAVTVQALQQKLQEFESMHAADSARVKAMAQAAVQRQSPKGHKIRVAKGWSVALAAVAVSPCGELFSHGADDDTAAVWDVATGSRMHELRGHSNRVMSVAWSPDGSRLATGSDDNTAAVWDVATGSRMHELRGHSHEVRSVAWSPDGGCVYTDSIDGTVRIYDVVQRR